MKMKIFSIIFIMVVLMGCTHAPETVVNNGVPEKSATAPIEKPSPTKTQSLNPTSVQTPPPTPMPAEKNINEKNDFYSLTAIYPIDPMDKTNAIEQFVKNEIGQKEEDWKIGGKVYNDEQKIAKDFPDRPKMQYVLDIKYAKYTSEKLETVSYIFLEYVYVGGANGDTTVTSFTFDKNGKVDISSILDFSNNQDLELTKVLAKTASKDSAKFSVPGILEDGLGLSFLKSDGKTLDTKKCNCDGFLFASNFQAFSLNNQGMTFFFSKGALAPRAAGVTNILITWEDLSAYLTPEFKARIK